MYEEAIYLLNKFILTLPGTARASLIRGGCFRALGESKHAIGDYSAALEVEVGRCNRKRIRTRLAVLNNASGRAMYRAGAYQEALEAFDDAISSYPYYYLLCLHRGHCHVQLGDKHAAQEDSMGNVLSLMPYPPRKVPPWLSWRARLCAFAGHLHTDKPVDRDRRLIVSYFLEDKSVKVYEPPIRNSGVMYGLWMSRKRMKNLVNGEFFTAADFYAGSVVTINAHKFCLGEPDAWVAAWMEAHPDTHPYSDIQKIKAKVAGHSELRQHLKCAESHNAKGP
eukprot:Clim_evm70s153 gene=Clim_evmTU70s153